MRTSVDVHNYLMSSGIDHEIVLLDEECRDVVQAAARCGLRPEEFAQAQLFELDGEHLLVLAPGGRTVSQQRLAELAGAKKCRGLGRRETMRITDFPAGALPPVALKADVRIVVDEKFGHAHCIYTSAGEHGAVLKIRLQDLVSRLEARLWPVT